MADTDRESINIVLNRLMGIFLIVAIIMLGLGIYKMAVYENASYHFLNAYVGGDAFNYIINGTYSISFFVLSMGFFLGSLVCYATKVISNTILDNRNLSQNKSNLDGSGTVDRDELPDI